MRWKLVVFASLTAALVAFGLWCAFVIGLFGSARNLAQSDIALLSSFLIPAVFITLAGVFTYRHTSKRRKLQALITIVASLVLTAAAYLIATTFFAARLNISNYQVRSAK